MNELGIKPEHECFDIGHVGELEPLVDMGVLKPPLHVDCVMGVVGGIPPTARNLAAMADNVPDGRTMGRDRDLARPVDARRRRADARRPVRVGLEDNFYLPDGEMARSNGDLIAKAREMVAGRRPAGRRRSPRRARCSASPKRARGMSLPLDGVRVLDLSRLLPGGFCSLLLADFGADVVKVEDTGMGDYVRWAPPYHEGAERERERRAVPRAQPRQALGADRPQDRRAGARCCCAWRATPTSCSSPSAPACWIASASATSACARRTRGSSTARSPATARTGRSPRAPATT